MSFKRKNTTINKITGFFLWKNPINNIFQLPTTINVRHCLILYRNKHISQLTLTKFAMPSTVLVSPWSISRAYVIAIFTARNLVLAGVIGRMCVSITGISLAMRATGGALC